MNDYWCPWHGKRGLWLTDGVDNPRCGVRDQWDTVCRSRPVLPAVIDAIAKSAKLEEGT